MNELHESLAVTQLQGFRVRNYRALKDVRLGRLPDAAGAAPLTPLTAIIGRNGVGKSTLIDAFGLLADCLKFGVQEACEIKGRGGFEHLRSLGSRKPICFDVYWRDKLHGSHVHYEVKIDRGESGKPFLRQEYLRRIRPRQSVPEAHFDLKMKDGRGFVRTVHTGEGKSGQAREDQDERQVELVESRLPGLVISGALQTHHSISEFRRFMDGWYFGQFALNFPHQLPQKIPYSNLNSYNDNLANLVQFMQQNHPDRLRSILTHMAKYIPGIERIDTARSSDGRLLLRFNDRGFQDPFYAPQMSDGTLKLFSFLLMLEAPDPAPLICIELPEISLYHKILEPLAAAFRTSAIDGKDATQIFVTTHQPCFVNGLAPEEIWILEKDVDGFSNTRRASEDKIVRAMVAEGLPLGDLWYSNFLDS